MQFIYVLRHFQVLNSTSYHPKENSGLKSKKKMGYGHNMDKMSTNIDYNIFIISLNSGINRT